jgi:hypothetical protein
LTDRIDEAICEVVDSAFSLQNPRLVGLSMSASAANEILRERLPGIADVLSTVLGQSDSEKILHFVWHLYRWDPSAIRRQIQRVAEVLVQLPLLPEYASVVVEICVDASARGFLVGWFVSQIESNPFLAHNLHTQFSEVEFNEDVRGEISDAALSVLRVCEANARTLRLVPGVLQTLSPAQYHRHVDALLTCLFAERSASVRLAILRCFVPPFPNGLRSLPRVWNLRFLLDDPDERVKLSVIELIKSLNQTPIIFIAVCRNLEDLSPRCVAELVTLWAVLFSLFPDSAVRDSPKYIGRSVLFLDSGQTEGRLTCFAVGSRQRRAVASLETLSYFAATNFDQVDPMWDRIVDLLLRLLAFGMAHAESVGSLRLISILAHGFGVARFRSHPSLYSSLVSLGAAITSRDVHTLLFQIFWYIGVMRPPESPLCFWMDDDGDLLNVNRTVLRDDARSEMEFYFRHSASVLFSVLDKGALAEHHLLALSVFARLFHIDRDDPTRCVPQLLRRFMADFLRVADADAVRVDDCVFQQALEVHCEVPSSWLAPHVPQVVSVVMRFSSVQCVRGLARSLGEALGPFLGEILPFLMGSGRASVSVSVSVADFVVLCGDRVSHASDAVAFLLPLAETSEAAREALFTIVAHRRVDDQLLPMLRFIQGHPAATFSGEALACLAHRHDLRFQAAGLPARAEAPPREHRLAALAALASASVRRNLAELTDLSALSVRAIAAWFSRFEQLSISQSPHRLLAAFAGLAQLCHFVARGLLPVAFYSVFAAFEEREAARFTALFRDVLGCADARMLRRTSGLRLRPSWNSLTAPSVRCCVSTRGCRSSRTCRLASARRCCCGRPGLGGRLPTRTSVCSGRRSSSRLRSVSRMRSRPRVWRLRAPSTRASRRSPRPAVRALRRASLR